MRTTTDRLHRLDEAIVGTIQAARIGDEYPRQKQFLAIDRQNGC